MPAEHASDRAVLSVSGSDARDFLQGLVTNDLDHLKSGLVYAALLSPQGKYLFDFLMFEQGGAICLDIRADRADALAARLSMYRLRADVQIEKTALKVFRGLGDAPADGLPDPRSARLGWRYYGDGEGGDSVTDWDAIRVAELIPETGVELIENDSYILECGFERLNGVDFRKGCYVGQEVTARMKHKTELRKGLARVTLDRPVATGTAVLSGEREIGTIRTIAGTDAIAYLRFDQAQGDLKAGEASVTVSG
ncbi:MAG: folate-binding protein [Rhodobacteraceae bacterium]|nr:folate-binding protein [Paracoccaceae bacterium]